MKQKIEARQLSADALLYLLAIARTGRISGAAITMGVDSTTASRRIRALEKKFGTRLIESGPHGWELTEIGRKVVESARTIEEALEQAALAGSGAPSSLTGSIRLAVPDGFGIVFAVPAIQRLREKHPRLDVELVTTTRNLVLHQSGFDMAVAVGEPPAGRLVTEILAYYHLQLYASEQYLALHGTPRDRFELEDHTVIFYVDSLLQVGDLDLEQYLPGIKSQFSSTSIFAQLEAVRSGAGIGLLPKFMALRAPELRAIDVGVAPRELPFALAARRESAHRDSVRAVRAALIAELTDRAHELM